MGVGRVFSYKTIERGYDDWRVRRLLEEGFRLTNVPVQGLERVFKRGRVWDGDLRSGQLRGGARPAGGGRSGLGRVAGGGRHAGLQSGGVGVKYKLLAAWRPSTDAHARELAHFPAAFAEAKANQPGMGILLGDGLYAGRPQVQLVAAAGVLPRFLPRRNVTLKRLGVGAWIEMLVSMAREPDQWFSTYHGRSISETGFNVTNDGVRIRKRLDGRKQTESFLKGVVYNIRRLAQLRYLVDLIPLDPGYAC